MNKMLRTIAAAALLYSPFIAAHSTFSNFYFFGDSLSDMGNQPGTRNNGAFWSQLLAKRYGIDLQASNQGGTDWANAAARTYDHDNIPGVQTQINNYLAQGPVDRRGLYTIWVGANDLNEVATHPVDEVVNTAVSNTAIASNRLHDASARYIMVLNLPDIGKTPAYNSNPELSQMMSQLTNFYNANLAATLNNTGYNIIQIDINSTFNAIIADPKRYGFSNVTSQYVQDKDDPSKHADPSEYLFYDDLHPTEAGSQLIYDAVMADFQGAANAAVLADAPMATMTTVNTALSNELLALRSGGQGLQEGNYRTFATALYAPTLSDRKSNLLAGYRQGDAGLLVGVDYRWSKNLILGTAISHSSSHIDFSGPGGSFKMDENLWSVFAGYQQSNCYANGIINLGLLEYRNINRNIPLYRALDVATGRTHGTHIGAQFETGYYAFTDKIHSGPFVTASYQYIDVDAYAESGATPGRNLHYFQMVNDSLVTGLGWQALYPMLWKNKHITPFAQLSFNKEWLRNKNCHGGMREIDVSEVTLPGSRSTIPVGECDHKGWLLANVGVNAQLNQYLFASLSMQATLLKKPYHSYGIMASVQMPF